MMMIGYAYAVFLLLGGMYGYLRAKSTVSLFSGVGSAVVAGLAAYISTRHPHIAEALAGLLSAAMIVLFIFRYRKTGKAMPAIPMVVVSVLVLAGVALEATKR
jgi:uncharacterized membrane protein (UPF0136 family)